MNLLLMIDYSEFFTNPNGWITLIIGSFISALIPFLMYTMKPKLKILTPCYNDAKDQVSIPIENIGCKNAVNLKIEVCLVITEDKKEKTCHVEIDKDDFIILPTNNKKIKEKNKREFKAKINHSEFEKLNKGYYLRVRIHANHEYSGFGKAFEARFSCQNGVFENIGDKKYL